MVAISPYGGMVPSLDNNQFDVLCSAVAEHKCQTLIGAGTLNEAAEIWRPHPARPLCGFTDCAHDSRTPAGRRRWRRSVCDAALSALTGTVLEFSKKELPTWGRFITCMCRNAPVDLVAEVCGIRHKTAFEWRHRVFATVDGYQGQLKLSGRVWIDEPCLTDSGIVRGADFVQKGGLSKNKVCIAVAIDAFKNAAVCVRNIDTGQCRASPGSPMRTSARRPTRTSTCSTGWGVSSVAALNESSPYMRAQANLAELSLRIDPSDTPWAVTSAASSKMSGSAPGSSSISRT